MIKKKHFSVPIEEKNDRHLPHVILKVLIVLVLSVLALLQLFPFYLEFIQSVQPIEGFTPVDGKVYFWPVSWNWSNYVTAIQEGDLLIGLRNTLIVSCSFTILSAVIILVVGYVLSKKKFKGRNIITIALLITMMVPGQLLMITNYQLVSSLHWTSTFAALILPGIVNVTGIFLVKAFMDSVPNEVLEAAKIDGAGEVRTLFQIVMPMCLPVLATYFIMTFIAQWNDYLWPMLVTGNEDLYTIQLKLVFFGEGGGGGWREAFLKSAALISTLLPVIVVYAVCQKKLIGGLNISGIK
ncbi:MAG: carbohydrate ABC transporter permease [Bacilli bacterium]|nr:carbohydrate ABC transporter permease [Bacilli bacterium]